MLISRNITEHIRELALYFPIISLTGPRQAGKTTLLKSVFPDYQYISLEDPDIRDRAQADMRSFLKQYNHKVIFDEAQRLPELFSYLQTMVDEDRIPGRFILSGSQNFLLRQNITQSLAGRVGIARIFPLDFDELQQAELLPTTYEEAIYRGFYPSLYDLDMPPRLFYPSYEFSYIERDISGIINTANLDSFRLFTRICASFCGQLLSYTALANTVGVSVNTIKSWLSILEQSYIVFRVPPYFRNFGKRLVKTPKLYFYDTGLLCSLLEIQSAEQVADFDQKGALFENLIMAERVKQAYHKGQVPHLYFFRDSNQEEVDLWEEKPGYYEITEIKSTRTFQSKLLNGLHKMSSLPVEKTVQKKLVYGGDESFDVQDVSCVSWRDYRS